MPIRVTLQKLLDEQGMTTAELARRIGVHETNVGKLKNDRAAAIRFSTLDAICRELKCTPGDIFSRVEATEDE